MSNQIYSFTNLKRLKPSLPSTGLHRYDIQQPESSGRIHLRVDPDGSGVLIVNASRILYLNQTATFMVYSILEEVPTQKILAKLKKIYAAPAHQLRADLASISMQLAELVKPNGLCPIHDLELDIAPPFQSKPSAPYRMDLAVTYRCNNDCYHCYNERPRDFPELPTESWQRIIDRTWDIGIPHVVFTGGEPTLRTDLPELIRYAETKGLVTGLNTNGRKLSNQDYLSNLISNGLDHAQITLESHNPDIHDYMVHSRGAWNQTVQGIRNALASNLYVMTNTTLLVNNYSTLSETLDFLADLGVPTIGLNALIYSGKGRTVNTGLQETELFSLLKMAQEKTELNNQRLIWYTPTHYCNFDPMQLQLGIKGCTAALYNMCIEPDGSVIPCQSYYQQMGNILVDNWNAIWNHDLALNLRNRHYLPQKCQPCSLRMECGGGCPLSEVELPIGVDFGHGLT